MASGDGRNEDRLIAHWGDLVREWQMHRIAFNNAIGILSHEVLQLRDRMDKDDAQRVKRQAQLDAQLDAIQKNQRWWLRFVVLVALMGAGIAIGWWLL